MTKASDPTPSLTDRARAAAATANKAMPGVLVALTVAMAAMFLGARYGAPVMLFALLLGMAFHFLSVEGRCVVGIEIAAKRILRIGVALLGARITADQIVGLGAAPVAGVVAAVVLTIFVGIVASRLLRQGTAFGVLTGGATAICGASAALAIASVLPRHRNHERDTLIAVIGVTTLSTVAMVIYPLVVAAFGLDDAHAGVFLGGTIHDVAQVVGAGYSVSEEAGDIATFTKMLRVAMLVPVVVVIAMVLRLRGMAAGTGATGLPLPAFLIVFVVLVAINSAGVLPEPARVGMIEVSRWCLVTAVAALGMKTSLKALAEVGIRPIALIVAQTLFMAGFVLGVILLIP